MPAANSTTTSYKRFRLSDLTLSFLTNTIVISLMSAGVLALIYLPEAIHLLTSHQISNSINQ
ncbi:MAG: hypothetical protein H7832_13510 [Magnetococcus sp. DMHC-6]